MSPYQKSKENPQWTISYSFLDSHIYKQELFIEGYPINSYTEEGKTHYSQSFKFNKLLMKLIGNLLLPKAKSNFIGVDQDTAWNYYHYTLYSGFRFNVHPVSMGSNFIRQELKGSQEEIYNICKKMYDKWISKDKNLI